MKKNKKGESKELENGEEVAKVNIMNVVGKEKRMGRYVGMTAASKKAIVTLTDSSKEIEFFQSL